MRLTLRTLLAWLDDTLSPTEVREIGQHVSESQFAQDLVQKIDRVTRQRRLSVPNDNGAEATDPSRVAAYLDNQLSAEEVAEYEKKCLTSDVHLAEVASVHQILSLIGQKAKVPPEARHRMYRLIKGREAVGDDTARSIFPDGDDSTNDPVVPWAAGEIADRPWYERFGPSAGIVALILILAFSAWKSVGPTPKHGDESLDLALAGDSKKPLDDKSTEEKPNFQPPVSPVAVKPKPSVDESKKSIDPSPIAVEKAKGEDQPTKNAANPPIVPVPSGAVGIVGETPAMLLRYDAKDRVWKRLESKASLRDGNRIVGLAPFRNGFQLGKVEFEMAATGEPLVRDGEVIVRAQEPGGAVRLDLVRGRLVIHGGDTETPVAVGFGSQVLTITIPAAGVVGVERLLLRSSGSSISPPTLRIYAPEGDVQLAAGAETTLIKGPSVITFKPPAAFFDKKEMSSPGWVTETSPSNLERELGKQFLSRFTGDADLPVKTSIMEAIEDDEKEIRRLAIAALGATGSLEEVVEVLNQARNPEGRRAAGDVLRAQLALSPTAEKTLGEILTRVGDENYATQVIQLLKGFSSAEAREEKTYDRLVGQLSAGEVSIRALALENLRALTGRDDLGYQPDAPTAGKGLNDWRELARTRQLRPGDKE